MPNVDPDGHTDFSMSVTYGPSNWAKQLANFGLFIGGKSLFASAVLVYTSATERTLVFWSLLLK